MASRPGQCRSLVLLFSGVIIGLVFLAASALAQIQMGPPPGMRPPAGKPAPKPDNDIDTLIDQAHEPRSAGLIKYRYLMRSFHAPGSSPDQVLDKLKKAFDEAETPERKLALKAILAFGYLQREKDSREVQVYYNELLDPETVWPEESKNMKLLAAKEVLGMPLAGKYAPPKAVGFITEAYLIEADWVDDSICGFLATYNRYRPDSLQDEVQFAFNRTHWERKTDVDYWFRRADLLRRSFLPEKAVQEYHYIMELPTSEQEDRLRARQSIIRARGRAMQLDLMKKEIEDWALEIDRMNQFKKQALWDMEIGETLDNVRFQMIRFIPEEILWKMKEDDVKAWLKTQESKAPVYQPALSSFPEIKDRHTDSEYRAREKLQESYLPLFLEADPSAWDCLEIAGQYTLDFKNPIFKATLEALPDEFASDASDKEKAITYAHWTLRGICAVKTEGQDPAPWARKCQTYYAEAQKWEAGPWFQTYLDYAENALKAGKAE